MRRHAAVVVLLLLVRRANADDMMPNAVPTVMYKRWAAAVTYGGSASRARSDNADAHGLFFFELALRFRIVTQLEVGGSIGGAIGKDVGVVPILADVRYRLAAEQPWNGFIYGGGGVATWGAADSVHLAVRGGVGLERRFKQWAFDARLELNRVSGDEMATGIEPHYGAWVASLGMSALYYWGSGGPSLRRHGVP